MLMKRATLSATLLGLSALMIATGMPTSQDSTTEISRDLGGERSAPQDHVGDAFGAEEGAAEVAAQRCPSPRRGIAPTADR